MRRHLLRGFTLSETVMAVSTSAIVIGASAVVFAFSVQQVQSETVDLNVVTQAHSLGDEIADVVSQASYVRLQTSGDNTAILCTVPTDGVDTDSDGINDALAPITITTAGLEVYNSDRLIGFVWGRPTAADDPTINKLDRAKNSVQPWMVTTDPSWAKVDGTPRWSLIRNVQFANDPARRQTIVIITAGANLSTGGKPGTPGDGRTLIYTITRRINWRNSL